MLMARQYYNEDIVTTDNLILAGLVTMVNATRAAGNNVEYLCGAIDAYQHQALCAGLDWSALLEQARRELDAGGLFLLDQVRLIDSKGTHKPLVVVDDE